ncbi:hypothetical protein DRO91_10535 [Candidatus Heimdallarchaeota archaeon]|nr:MAG: hypothetical protein DRO91_10535 [Candidatus Heimdallarchaeota archaeon]
MSKDEIWPAIINTGRVHPNALDVIVNGFVKESKKRAKTATLTEKIKEEPKPAEESIGSLSNLYSKDGELFLVDYDIITIEGARDKLYESSLNNVMDNAYNIIAKTLEKRLKKSNPEKVFVIKQQILMPTLFAEQNNLLYDLGRTDQAIEVTAFTKQRRSEIRLKVFSHPKNDDAILYQAIKNIITNYTIMSSEIIGAGVIPPGRKLPHLIKPFDPLKYLL